MKLAVKREIMRLARFVLPSAVAAAMSALPCAAEEAAAAAAVGGLEDGSAAHKWFSFKAYADIETAYVCRGYVWDARPYSAQFADAALDFGGFGRVDTYVWTMSAMSGSGHSTSMRYAYNEVDYGLRYFYDLELADEWVLSSGVGKQWVTNPGVRHGGHSLIDWQVMQSLGNPYLTPYWKLRYIRRPYQAAYWCVGVRRSFELADRLTLTVDFFGDLGDARHYRRLFGPKPGEPDSRYHGGLHALNLIVRLDYAITDWLGVYGFVGQFDLVSDDARDAVKASSAREAKRDLTYCGIGLEVDF